MSTRYEGAGARDVKITILRAGAEVGEDIVPEGQIALCFNYDEVFYLQGTMEDVWFVLDKARTSLRRIEEGEAIPPAVIQKDQPTYTADTEWGDPMMGKPTVYTYTFSDGRIFRQEETKNIVSGGFNQKVTLTAADGKKKRSSLRDLREATKAAKEEA